MLRSSNFEKNLGKLSNIYIKNKKKIITNVITLLYSKIMLLAILDLNQN